MKFKNFNKKYTQICAYVVITAIIIYILSLVANNFPFIFGQVMNKVSWLLMVIKPVILGFVLAYLVEPVVAFFQRQFGRIKFLRNKEKRCRGLAIFTMILVVLVVFGTIISLLVFSVTDQLRLANLDDIIILCNEYIQLIDEFSKNIMDKLKSLHIESDQLSKYLNDVGGYILGALEGMAKGAVGSVSNISSFLTTAVFSIIIAVYFLIDGKMIRNYLTKVSKALFSSKWNKKVSGFLADADMVFSGYIRGQLMDAFVMMIMISLVLSVVGVKFGIVIGILAGIGNLIPYCGPFIAYGCTILVSLLNGQYKQMVIAVVLLFIIQGIDGNFIGPKLLSKSINIHPVLVIISLIFGSAVGGLMGMLLAVPVGAFLKVLFVKYIDNRLAQKEAPAKKQESVPD